MNLQKPKSPLTRIARGGMLLLAVFVAAVIGYRVFGDYGWLESVWMVVVTISTVGYSESSTLSPGLQVLTIIVILVGMSAAAYTFGGLIQLLLEGEIDRLIGLRRMTAEIANMKDHVIICGYGRMGQCLASELKSQDRQIVIIENDPDRLREASTLDLACLTGDATEEATLQSVGIDRAKTLVAALSDDAKNVFLTLTARNLNEHIQIVARADQVSTEKKLRQAGANRVVMPTVVGSRQMARVITRPTTADLIELLSQQEFADLELEEVLIGSGSQLEGMSVGSTYAHRDHDLLFVAIQSVEGTLRFNPSAGQVFQKGEVLILMGHRSDIRAFRSKFGDSDTVAKSKGRSPDGCS
ncbi:Voltage-gated potassium channel Kch [Rubripirellula tenax]|uniref:Voltage-gated potassium channel Kch n=1 Tax=Rubripirellula tenax TaxID=2528015 RepID=A0A5C6EBP2_9BACT|nr:potassium channel protein [Rubripirellula tenax]TWU46140.1 Voltage-gated potassium channel Kch [Rubripirellula tenax]